MTLNYLKNKVQCSPNEMLTIMTVSEVFFLPEGKLFNCDF